MNKVINFEDFKAQSKKENLNAVTALLEMCRRMHDEEGYAYTSAELKPENGRRVVLTLVLEKSTPDDLPDIIA